MNLTFVVHGQPAPAGSKRHVGRGVIIETSKRAKPWREAVKFAALEVWDDDPCDKAVQIQVEFRFARPKSLKKSELHPTSRRCGDLSKLMRGTEDALVDAGVLADDSLICHQLVSKVYSPNIGATITVRKMP